MNKKRTSYAFLMEMLWVCGFFALAACIFVLAFVKADSLSKNAENLNHAVLAAENSIETVFAGYDGDDAPREILSGFDRNWNACEYNAPEAMYYVKINHHVNDGMLYVSAAVHELKRSNTDPIYSLNGARSLDAERRLDEKQN